MLKSAVRGSTADRLGAAISVTLAHLGGAVAGNMKVFYVNILQK
jgi:hypothetical protein